MLNFPNIIDMEMITSYHDDKGELCHLRYREGPDIKVAQYVNFVQDMELSGSENAAVFLFNSKISFAVRFTIYESDTTDTLHLHILELSEIQGSDITHKTMDSIPWLEQLMLRVDGVDRVIALKDDPMMTRPPITGQDMERYYDGDYIILKPFTRGGIH